MSKVLKKVIKKCNYECPYYKEDKDYSALIVDYPTCSIHNEAGLPHEKEKINGITYAKPTNEFPNWCPLTDE